MEEKGYLASSRPHLKTFENYLVELQALLKRLRTAVEMEQGVQSINISLLCHCLNKQINYILADWLIAVDLEEMEKERIMTKHLFCICFAK